MKLNPNHLVCRKNSQGLHQALEPPTIGVGGHGSCALCSRFSAWVSRTSGSTATSSVMSTTPFFPALKTPLLVARTSAWVPSSVSTMMAAAVVVVEGGNGRLGQVLSPLFYLPSFSFPPPSPPSHFPSLLLFPTVALLKLYCRVLWNLQNIDSPAIRLVVPEQCLKLQ